MREDIASKHEHCPLAIRWRVFGKNNLPTPGLFCQCHDAFLDWLPNEVAFDLIDNHKIPVENWIPRTKNKKPKVLTEVVKTKPTPTLRQKKIKKKSVKQTNKEYKKRFGILI